MPAEIFTALSNLRMLLDTETDADSPNDELLNDGYRYAIECLLMLLFGTGVSGTATSDPSNDANGYFYDTAGGWIDDQHNGRTLVITSGAAKGNTYIIDDTVNSSDRLDCTGDNLYADGVRSGDAYIILYDLKVNADGHDHDGVNSAPPVLADSYITKGKLKTAVSTASGTNSGRADITIADYCFFPNVYQADNGPMVAYGTNNGDYVARFSLTSGSGAAYAVYSRYITSSDEPFIYLLREKATGKILHCWMGDDPPPGYWGLSDTPEKFDRPIVGYLRDGKPEFDPELHEEIISWKVKKDTWAAIKDRQKAEPKAPHLVLEDRFEYDKSSRLWKTNNLTAL